MFGLSTFKLAIAGAAFLIVATGTVYLVKTIRDDGARAEREAVTTQNNEAGTNADDARLRFDNGCPDGLRFRSASGRCERIAPGGRD